MDIKGVTQSATQTLRFEIVTGKLPGGMRLNEIELSGRLGISRPPLREAFRRLENEGLVISIPRRGCFVAETSLEDWRHIGRARKMLEATAIEIMEQEGWKDFPLIRRAHEKAAEVKFPDPEKGIVKDEDVVAWFYALSDFHLCLVESSKNNWLLHCYKRLTPSMARYQIMYLNIPGSKSNSIQDHGDILDMLECGRYAEALNSLGHHIDQMRNIVTRNMQAEEELKSGRPSSVTD
ncbi:GntR family transcriptional regulator [Desulfocurvus sp. DL9XJH121]